MSNQGAKQQIVDKIIDSDAILVALSKSPSVDELSAALGLTMLLNAAKHRTTAIFSGDTPPVLQFLEPEKTFENSVDSLRDFIVAISKDKADNLRMKVEGDQAKIYITPYRTTIDESDLEFSQGEYNVDMVIALGVTDRDQLDRALNAHGKIFHDASVVSLSVGGEESTLGSIDWYEQNASSLSEMVMTLSDALHDSEQSVKMDKATATALLTGIVASTDRFSNSKTSPRVMNMASKLMSLGADQQLIATNLKPDSDAGGSEYDNQPAEPKKSRRSNKNRQKTGKKPKDPNEIGALSISHSRGGDVDEVGQQTIADNLVKAQKKAEDALARAVEQEQASADQAAEDQLSNQLDSLPAANDGGLSVNDIQKDLASAAAEGEADAKKLDEEGLTAPTEDSAQPEAPAPMPQAKSAAPEKMKDVPTLGGTLNATTEQAQAEKRRQEEADKNRTILSHSKGYVGDSQPTLPPVPINDAVNSQAVDAIDDPAFDSVADMQYEPTGRSERVITPPSQVDTEPEPVAAPEPSLPPSPVQPEPVAAPLTPPATLVDEVGPNQTLADLDELHRAMPQAHHPDDSARNAVAAALSEEAYNAKPEAIVSDTPAVADVGPGLPPPPPLPNFSDMGPAPDFSKLPPPPPIPDFPAPQPVAPAPLGNAVPPQEPSNPAQFQIPG